MENGENKFENLTEEENLKDAPSEAKDREVLNSDSMEIDLLN